MTFSVHVFHKLLSDATDPPEDDRVEETTDPDLSSPWSSPAATTTTACPALNVFFALLVNVCVWPASCFMLCELYRSLESTNK